MFIASVNDEFLYDNMYLAKFLESKVVSCGPFV